MRRRRVRIEWKLEDAWVGAYWERQAWWGGTMEALDASTTDYRGDADALKHRRFDLWVCLVPMVPIHFSSLWCPQPRECSSDLCWIREVGTASLRVVVPEVDVQECPSCRGAGRVHNLAMGPPHVSECTWCYVLCSHCQGEGTISFGSSD